MNTILIQPDKKILVGTNYLSSDPTLDSFVIKRFLPDGTADSSYGVKGNASIHLANASLVFDLSLQSNRKLLIGGAYYNEDNSKRNMLLCRLKDNGSIDSSFGKNGVVVDKWDSKSSEVISLLVQSDDKIIAAGNRYDLYQNNSDFAIVRYKKNGTIDSSFAINGKQLTNIEGHTVVVKAVLQPDGKILAGGNNYLDTEVGQHIVLARYIGTDIVLATTFLELAATTTNNGIDLSWSTSNEKNTSYFSIQRGSDCSNFAEIGKIKNKNNGTLNRYSFEDTAPLNGYSYYRIQQVTADNNFIYSKILRLRYTNDPSLKIFPNPVRDILHIEGLNSNKTALIKVFNVNGVIIKKVTTAIGCYNLNVRMLPAGTYYILIETNKKIEKKKLIKE
jgi:uncharacterized delta-60 repeat protein